MAYCLNPDCSSPHNEPGIEFCASCQRVLMLQARYLAIAPLASGGFGRTFLAVDQKDPLESRCVIKQSCSKYHTHQQNNQLFYQEALRLGQLGQNPQVPELLDYFEQDSFQYLVQEFIDGQDLAQIIKYQGHFAEEDIWQLLKDLLPVLQFIHDHHVIHRDIKPANIIRRRADQQLFLVDMGAAKHATGKALALTGTVIGSAEYVAPEQARGKATFASDIYSLGVTCIYLLTGVSPFSLYDSGDGKWVWRDFLLHPVSDHLGNLLDAMVQLPTNRRYQTCADVEANLFKATIGLQGTNALQAPPALQTVDPLSKPKDASIVRMSDYKPDTIDKAYGLLWIAFLLSLVFVI